MKNRLNSAKFASAMALAGASAGCANEVVGPDTYNLDFEATTIECGNIEHLTPYDKAHYCTGLEDSDEVTIDAFYDTTHATRAKIHAAIACVLAPLRNVHIEAQSTNSAAITTHFGGFARPAGVGKGTYDEGNTNEQPDSVYIADRYQSPDNIINYKEADMLTFVALHEIGHTLGLDHSQGVSIMYQSVIEPYPFYFTREHAKLLLENTNDQITEEKIEGLTKADERCTNELESIER